MCIRDRRKHFALCSHPFHVGSMVRIVVLGTLCPKGEGRVLPCLLYTSSALQAVVVLSLISAIGLGLGKIHVCGISLGVTLVFFAGIIAGDVYKRQMQCFVGHKIAFKGSHLFFIEGRGIRSAPHVPDIIQCKLFLVRTVLRCV